MLTSPEGVDPLISAAIIAFQSSWRVEGGGAFAADASELISGKMEQMHASRESQLTKTQPPRIEYHLLTKLSVQQIRQLSFCWQHFISQG